MCWHQHGAYKDGHRCRWTYRGTRRQAQPATVDDWKDEKELSHEVEAKLGLAGAHEKGQVPLCKPKQPVSIIVVDNDPANIALFKRVYEEVHNSKGQPTPLHELKGAELDDPAPYIEAGVFFLYGEQGACFPAFLVVLVIVCASPSSWSDKWV